MAIGEFLSCEHFCLSIMIYKFTISQFSVSSACATELYVMAFTSGAGDAGSDSSPYLSVHLRDGAHRRVRFYDRRGDDLSPSKGDIWRFGITSFGFSKSKCITKEDIETVTIEAGGNDGWNIDSVMTVLHGGLQFDVLTANMHVNRWIDGDGDIYHRSYTLQNV